MRTPRGHWARLMESLLPAVFPASCLVCDRDLPATASICCDACLAAFCEPGYQILAGDPGPRLRVVSLFPYEGSGRELVAAVKFHGRRRLLERLAARLARAARTFGVDESRPVFCPVPSTAAKMRERGGNPSAWLALELARWTGGATARTLRRVRRGREQKSLDRAGRLANLAECFRADPRVCRGLVGIRPWLVDDVVTTGATLEQCALELIRAGLPPAGALVLARTPLAGEWVGVPEPFVAGD